MPATFKLGAEKGLNGFSHAFLPFSHPQTEDVSIIVLTGAASTEDVMTQGGSYSPDLIGGDTHADAGVTYQNATFKVT
jgi:hypothetical protein